MHNEKTAASMFSIHFIQNTLAQLTKCYKLWSLFRCEICDLHIWSEMMAVIWSEMSVGLYRDFDVFANDSLVLVVGYIWLVCLFRLHRKRKYFTAKCVCIMEMIKVSKWIKRHSISNLTFNILKLVSFEVKTRRAHSEFGIAVVWLTFA